MFAALWLPRFQLQAVLRARPAEKKALFALLDADSARAQDKGLVLHASEAAEKRGIHA